MQRYLGVDVFLGTKSSGVVLRHVQGIDCVCTALFVAFLDSIMNDLRYIPKVPPVREYTRGPSCMKHEDLRALHITKKSTGDAQEGNVCPDLEPATVLHTMLTSRP